MAIRRIEKASISALLALWFWAAPAARAFDAIYAFGDSLTDTGNKPAPAPDYFQGRYSNGALWIEYLSTQLGLDYAAQNNFAKSGGETSDALAQVEQFNSVLMAASTAIATANPDLQLLTPDVAGRFNELLSHLGANGFTKADPDALDDPQLSDKSFTGPGQDYVFWDPI